MRTPLATGDVVVRLSPGRKAPRYAVRTASGVDQLLFVSCDAALAHALAFARFAGVAAWIDDPEGGLVLLGSHRIERFSPDAPDEQAAHAVKRLGGYANRVAPNLQS